MRWPGRHVAKRHKKKQERKDESRKRRIVELEAIVRDCRDDRCNCHYMEWVELRLLRGEGLPSGCFIDE